MNQPLAQVIDHLKGIARESLTLLNDISARRALIERYFAAASETGDYSAKITATRAGTVPAEWIQAEGADPDRRLLYIHGGSWISGSAKIYRPMLSRLSELTGLSILAIDYRLAPENPFPAGLDDSYAAYLWLRKNSPQGETPAQRCFIMGDSAGGNLTLACLNKLKDNQQPQPDAAIALSPATDFTGQSPSLKTKAEVDPIINPAVLPLLEPVYIRGAVPLDHPYCSPLFGDLGQLPPTLLQVGEAEVLLDDAVRYADKANAEGGNATLQQWPDMPHVFQGFAPLLPEAVEAIEKMAAFIREFD